MVVDHNLLNAEYQIEHGGFRQFLIGQGVDGPRFNIDMIFEFFEIKIEKNRGTQSTIVFEANCDIELRGNPSSNVILCGAVGCPPHSLQLIQRQPHFVVLVGDPHFRVLEHRVPNKEREQRSPQHRNVETEIN